MAGAPKYPDPGSGWLPYQPLITRLWMDEKRPLREVMQIMETQHGFKATYSLWDRICLGLANGCSTKMYKSRLSAWGLYKHNKLNDVQEILRQRERRRALGKKSIFVLRGRPVDMADIERYAKRKGLDVSLGEPTPAESIETRDLVCLTPPATPSRLDAPTSLQNVERFLHSLNAFMQGTLQSGVWSLETEIGGCAFLRGPAYPRSARDGFFLSIERGMSRYSWEEMTQAYHQWRQAFSSLPSIVRTKNPSQLLCLLELVARLAKCEQEVAALLLRFLGDLVKKEQGFSDIRVAMIQSLSRLETGNLTALVGASNDCCRNAFRTHFSSNSFFLVDSEILLTDSGTGSPKDADAATLRLNDSIPGYGISDHEELRSIRTLMARLMAAEKNKEAESVALNCLTRMHQMRYDGVVGGALSYIYSSLIHVYLSTENYEKAYDNMIMRSENYFDMLICRSDLPVDSLVGMYHQLACLARTLGRDGDADRWNREYNIAKLRADHLAEREPCRLEVALNTPSPEQACEPVGSAKPQSLSIAESQREMIIEGSLAPPPCDGHVFHEPVRRILFSWRWLWSQAQGRGQAQV